MPHSGPHFSTFWCVSMPKCSILGPLGARLGPKMAPKIVQVAPKCRTKLNNANLFCRLVSKIAFGALLGTILIDLGWFFDEFC